MSSASLNHRRPDHLGFRIGEPVWRFVLAVPFLGIPVATALVVDLDVTDAELTVIHPARFSFIGGVDIEPR